MSLPRQVLPGATYLVTRRCTQRRFLLKPTKRTTQAFAYVLAVAADRTGVLIHAVCVLSNHWHAVVTDPLGNLPLFMAYVHKYVAKCVNADLGRWENLWSNVPYSAVRLDSAQDIWAKVVYTLSNPVAAGLVSHGSKWPGLHADWTTPPMTVARPDWFFRPSGPMPASCTLTLVPPPMFEPGGVRLARELHERLAVNEAQIRRARNGKFLGVRRISRQRVTDSPRKPEPRRKLSPRIACRDRWRRIEALARLRDFVDGYRAALAEWRAGVRTVVFPAGTFAMVRLHGARCA